MLYYSLQNIRMGHHLMAKEESWLMPFSLAMVLVEMCTLMPMKTGVLILLVQNFKNTYTPKEKPTLQQGYADIKK